MTWPDTGPTLACPHCRGPIGYWVLQPAFTCHHCRTALSSNHRTLQLELAAAALAIWLIGSAAVSLLMPTNRLNALLVFAAVWLQLAFGLGWFALRRWVKLRPLPTEEGLRRQP